PRRRLLSRAVPTVVSDAVQSIRSAHAALFLRRTLERTSAPEHHEHLRTAAERRDARRGAAHRRRPRRVRPDLFLLSRVGNSFVRNETPFPPAASRLANPRRAGRPHVSFAR